MQKAPRRVPFLLAAVAANAGALGSIDANAGDELADVIRRTVGRGGTVLIPAFAVGRAQLLLQGNARAPLHRLLNHWLHALEQMPSGRAVRWSLDVDPIDLF